MMGHVVLIQNEASFIVGTTPMHFSSLDEVRDLHQVIFVMDGAVSRAESACAAFRSSVARNAGRSNHIWIRLALTK